MTPNASSMRDFYRQHPELLCSPFVHSCPTAARLGTPVSLRGEGLLNLAEVKVARRVLDVGCGTGHLLAALASRAHSEKRQVELHGVDIENFLSPQAQLCVQHHAIDVNRESLPYDDESFEVVFCTEVCEHVVEQAVLVREIARVLCPNGSAICSSPSYLNAAGLCKAVLEGLRVYSRNTWAPFARWTPQQHEQMMTAGRLRRLLTEAGLSITTAVTFWHLDGLLPWLLLLPEQVCFGRHIHWLRNRIDRMLGDVLPTGLQCLVIAKRVAR